MSFFFWIHFGCRRKVTRKADQNKNNNDKNTTAFHFVFSYVFYSINRHFQAGCYYCQPMELRKGNVFSHASVLFRPQVWGKGSRSSHVTVTRDAFSLTERDPHCHHSCVKWPHCTVILSPLCLWTLFANVCQAGGSHPTGMLSWFADVIDGHVLLLLLLLCYYSSKKICF